MFMIIPIGVNSNNINNIKPKPLQNVLGKSIIEYLLDNLNTKNITKVFIPYDKELKNYFFEDYLKNKYKKINFKFFVLNQPTKGPLDTILTLLNTINEEDCPIINLDCDNFYKIDIIKKWNGENKIFLFEDLGDNNVFSFVKIKNNNNNLVENIEERNRISNLACTGAYGFKSWHQLKNIGNNLLENYPQHQEQSSKFYISSIIKELIKIENIKYEIISNYIKKPLYNTSLNQRHDIINKNSKSKNQQISQDLNNNLKATALKSDSSKEINFKYGVFGLIVFLGISSGGAYFIRKKNRKPVVKKEGEDFEILDE